MLIGATILFVLVMALFGLALLRPGFGRGLPTRSWILVGGLALPLPVLAGLLALAFDQGEQMLPKGTAMRIEATARQWSWEFSYPEFPDIPATVGVMHVPAGRPVDVVARSLDVIHSFWVPRLGGKIDATPGHTTVLRLVADRPGTFGGLCAEYCGTGHTEMTFSVESHDPADYADRLRAAAEQR